MAIVKKPSKRSMSAQQTREKIFNTAISLFEQYGYDQVTVDDITKHVGVSKGSFYNYFESKDAVLVEQFNKIDDFYLEFSHTIPRTISNSDKVLLFISAMCHYTASICGLNVIKIVYMNQISTGKRTDILTNENRPIYTFFEEIVQHGQKSGEFTTEYSVREIVDFFSRAARSIIFEWCLHDGKMDLKDEAERYMRLILKSVQQ